MKSKLFLVPALALLCAFNFQPTTAHAQGTAFTYEGQLNSGGSPANGSYDLVFTLYTTNTTGSAIAGPVTNSATGVTNGLFTTLVDFGTGAFTGTSNWLQLAVRTNATGTFAPLAPRQQVTPTPYAITAENAGGLNGLTIQQYSSGAPNLIVGAADNVIAPGTIGATIDGGTNNSVAATWSGLGGGYGNSIAAAAYFSWLGGGEDNIISNNATYAVIGGGYNNTIQINSTYAVISGGQNNTIQSTDHDFIGGGGGNGITNDSYSSIVGGFQNTMSGATSYSFIGGGSYNYLAASATDSVLVGGTQSYILDSYGVLGGGEINHIQLGGTDSALVGGYHNTISGSYGFVGGGEYNTINVGGQNNSIVGGEFNTAGGRSSTVGGGENNNATGGYSTVGGGYQNYATNSFATVPGGAYNVASGVASFAAGTAAQAINDGAFVWADVETNVLGDIPFTSIRTNSFNVRANGGVRFVTGGAGLTVDGQSVMTGLPAGVVTNGETYVTLGNLIVNTNLLMSGNLGIGGNLSFLYTNVIITAGGNRLLASDTNYNSSFGLYAGVVSGTYNTELGAYAIASGTNNTALGADADAYGNKNTALGMFATAIGTNNTALGAYALAYGNNNTVLGADALSSGIYVYNNTVTGNGALENLKSGSYNTADGGFALQNLVTGDYNIALGYNAGNNLTNGTNNIYIGNGAHTSESGVIRIGQAGNQTATYLVGTVTTAGSVGIGTLTPSATLEVNGNAQIDGPVTTTGSVGIGTSTPSATLEVNGNAQIDGPVAANYLRAPGSGVNTHTYAFIQVATAGNTSGYNTEIDNPICDGDPNAILIVTHNVQADTDPFDDVHSPFYTGIPTVGVNYNGQNWLIQNNDVSTMPLGRAYNVMIIKP